jgi:hypothetical protein
MIPKAAKIDNTQKEIVERLERFHFYEVFSLKYPLDLSVYHRDYFNFAVECKTPGKYPEAHQLKVFWDLSASETNKTGGRVQWCASACLAYCADDIDHHIETYKRLGTGGERFVREMLAEQPPFQGFYPFWIGSPEHGFWVKEIIDGFSIYNPRKRTLIEKKYKGK